MQWLQADHTSRDWGDATARLVGAHAIPYARDVSVNVPSLADTPVTALKGVGPKNAERLQRLGIDSVQDLLFHLPIRYQDRTRIVPIGSLRPGDQAVIQGEVELADIRYGRRRSLLVRLADGTGSITLRFFHFSNAQKANMARGSWLRCFGEVRNGPQTYELVHPEVQRVAEGEIAEVEQALTPIYPTTEGMHQLTWRDLTGHALAMLGSGGLQELLPDALLREYAMPELVAAVRLLHRPPPDESQRLLSDTGHPAQRRLAFEELLAHQLSLRVLRQRQRRRGAPALHGDGSLQRRLLDRLPFQLTDRKSVV